MEEPGWPLGGGTEWSQDTQVSGEAMLSPVEQTGALRGKHSYQGASHQEITNKPHQLPVNVHDIQLAQAPDKRFLTSAMKCTFDLRAFRNLLLYFNAFP